MSEIVLGGQTRRLAFTFATLKRLEKERGLNLWDVEARTNLVTPSSISALLWGALLVENPQITEVEADALFELPRQKEILSRVMDAVLEALGVPPEAPLASTSGSSGTADAPPSA